MKNITQITNAELKSGALFTINGKAFKYVREFSQNPDYYVVVKELKTHKEHVILNETKA